MVNGPAAAHGVALLRLHGCLDLVGLHLNFTEGSPVAPPEKVPSLLRTTRRRSGSSHCSSNFGWERLPGPLFLGKAQFVEACRLGTVAEAHVQREARAQVGRQPLPLYF
jgi:hypothetical protein